MATDEELTGLIKEGSRAAFEMLYRRYFRELYMAVHCRVRSKELTEEIIQELFTDIWSNKERAEIRQFRSYIFMAVKYSVFKYFRKEYLHARYTESLDVPELINDTEVMVSYRELSEQFEAAMQHLPEKTRRIYVLSRKENKTNKQIATLLGVTEKTVEYHITKSIAQIKVDLRDFIAFS